MWIVSIWSIGYFCSIILKNDNKIWESGFFFRGIQELLELVFYEPDEFQYLLETNSPFYFVAPQIMDYSRHYAFVLTSWL